MKITKNFGWVKESAFAFSILNFVWLNLMGEVLGVVLGVVMSEVCDEILTNHQYMTLIEKWPLQEWQALSLFHCMHFQNKSILHNFLACNLYQWIKFWTLETTKSSKTISRDLCYCQVNLTRKSYVQRCDFGHELGVWLFKHFPKGQSLSDPDSSYSAWHSELCFIDLRLPDRIRPPLWAPYESQHPSARISIEHFRFKSIENPKSRVTTW